MCPRLDQKTKESLRDFSVQYPLWTAIDQFLDSKWGKRALVFLGGAVMTGIGAVWSFVKQAPPALSFTLLGFVIAWMSVPVFALVTFRRERKTRQPLPASEPLIPPPPPRIRLRCENREPYGPFLSVNGKQKALVVR
jgi:hypothetical protein